MNADAELIPADQIAIQSPFLPGTYIQYAWDSTSLGYLKTCPRLYQLIMIEGWSPKEDSVHLRFGQEYHKALEDYDRIRFEGEDHETALRTVVGELLVRIVDWHPDTTTRAGKYKNPDTLLSLVIDYLDKFEEDPAETYTLQDGVPAVELSFRFELDWGPKLPPACINTGFVAEQPYILCGHLDRVVRFNGAILGTDRKTTTTAMGDYYMSQFEPNNQMSLYTLALQVVLASPVKGMMIDGAQVLLEKPNDFKRGFTFRTPDQTNEWVADLHYWFAQAEAYAVQGYWPMNDTACDKFGGCKFRGICSKDPKVREQFLKSGFNKLPEEERWNPLKPR